MKSNSAAVRPASMAGARNAELPKRNDFHGRGDEGEGAEDGNEVVSNCFVALHHGGERGLRVVEQPHIFAKEFLGDGLDAECLLDLGERGGLAGVLE